MSRTLLAGFDGPERMLAAASALREEGRPALEAFTPYPVEGAAAALAIPKPRLPWAMLAGGPRVPARRLRAMRDVSLGAAVQP